MRIYDTHMHSAWSQPADPKRLIASLEETGIFGACVYSAPPRNDRSEFAEGGADFEPRLERVLEWCEGYEGRLFPYLWIHPDERGIRKKVKIAAERGIAAFKLIPYNFHAYEKKNLRLMHEIAEMGKPVILHAGILWNNSPSARYTQPASYEALMTVPNLRFALAHCAWPWIDECLALFGKINHVRRTWGRTAEMFIDITPGTPGFYRRLLFERLYGGVYNATKHTLFGVDSNANAYNVPYAKGIIERDEALYKEFGVSDTVRSLVYEENLFHFLGIQKPEDA